MLLSFSSNHFEAPRDQAKNCTNPVVHCMFLLLKCLGKELGLEICLIKTCTCECYGYYVFESYSVGTLIGKQITSNARN